MRRGVAIVALVTVTIFSLFALVEAQSSCTLTKNYPDGFVPLGCDGIVTASADGSAVNYVRFMWTLPGFGHRYYDSTYNEGDEVECSQRLTVLGTWSVKADFYYCEDGEYSLVDTKCASFDVRSNSINTVPEVPLVGSIGVSLAMIFGFTVFKLKKKSPNP